MILPLWTGINGNPAAPGHGSRFPSFIFQKNMVYCTLLRISQGERLDRGKRHADWNAGFGEKYGGSIAGQGSGLWLSGYGSGGPAAGGGAPPGAPGRDGGPLFSGRGGARGALGGVRPGRDRPRGQRGLPGGGHRPPEGRGSGDLSAGAPGGAEGPDSQSGLPGHRPGAGSDPGGHHGPPGPSV